MKNYKNYKLNVKYGLDVIRTHEPRHVKSLQMLNNNEFWLQFNDYLLKNVSNDTAKYRLSCAKKYCHVLLEENAIDLLQLPNEKNSCNEIVI